jgi:hypothetical protein
MRRRNSRSGNMVLETALWMPVLFLLITGIIQFGKITYIYYSLKKTVNTVADYLAVQSGVNFCPDAGDPSIAAAIQFALTGTSDGSGPVAILDLTPDMIVVTPQCIDPTTGLPGTCDVSGCNTPVGAQRPDYIQVTIPNGYNITPRIPYILFDAIPLKPQAVAAYGGAS